MCGAVHSTETELRESIDRRDGKRHLVWLFMVVNNFNNNFVPNSILFLTP